MSPRVIITQFQALTVRSVVWLSAFFWEELTEAAEDMGLGTQGRGV